MVALNTYYLKISRSLLHLTESCSRLLIPRKFNDNITNPNSFIMKLFTPYLTYKAKNSSVQLFIKTLLLLSATLQKLPKSLQLQKKTLLLLSATLWKLTKSLQLQKKSLLLLSATLRKLTKSLQLQKKTLLLLSAIQKKLSKSLLLQNKTLHIHVKEVQIRFSGLYQNLMYLLSNILLSQINSHANIKRYFQKHIKCKLNILVFSFFNFNFTFYGTC